MERDYVDIQKESIDKGPEAMSLEGAENFLSFIQQYWICKQKKKAKAPFGS